MNLEGRKIEFIQEFLKIQSEEVISSLENLLRKERVHADEKIFEPMTIEQLNNRIDQSESEFQNKKFKTSAQLLSKYK